MQESTIIDRWSLTALSRIYAMTHEDRVKIANDEDTSDEELAVHWHSETPILLKGAARHWSAIGKWTPGHLRSAVSGTVGVGISETGAYRTRATLTVRMDVGEALEKVLLAPPGERRYYIKNIRMGGTCFEPLIEDVGSVRLLPRGALHGHARTSGPPDPFVWIGQAGNTTALHFDKNPNVIVTVSGCKTYTLISPMWSDCVYPEPTSSPTFWYSQLGTMNDLDPNEFPRFARVLVHRVELCAGDALFVPPGWWHRVGHKEASISVNFFYRDPHRIPFWTSAQRKLNPNHAHRRLSKLTDMARFVRYLRSGESADLYNVYTNMFTVDELRKFFNEYKSSWNPLYRWALSRYPNFESTPIYRDRMGAQSATAAQSPARG